MRRLVVPLVIAAATAAACVLLALTPAWALGARGPSSQSVIRSVFGAGSPRAVRIARCESGLKTHAVSRTGDHGLFQINAATWFGQVVSFYKTRPHVWIRVNANKIYGARYNSLVAWAISKGGTSWLPWTCSRLVP